MIHPMSDTLIPEKRTHFVRQMIEEDLKSGKHTKIITRFPPEPNGYLHIGHAKAISVDFGLAEEFNGDCYLRLDDTNPTAEEEEFALSIMEDVHWLGYDWDSRLTHSSDYYEQLYQYALDLIRQGDAYVESLSADEIRDYRGTLQAPGKESPDRDRSIDENLDLFQRMKAGEFPEGKYILRAKIDMASGNINLRDPALYRIRFATHQRTGDDWCIYPMYDFAHPLCDALEHITHSLCSIEFQDHRPLYDWFINKLNVPAKPVQTEFARLNVSHTITSKRKLKQLVESNLVDGWDDPRMPTLRGLRRRGYPPAALRHFCELTGLSKSNSVIDMSVLEECVRDELNKHAPRAMLVLKPLKVVIENFPEQETQEFKAACHPQNPVLGERSLFFTRELYIDHDDFMEVPEKGYFRLSPGSEVRLRHGYVIRCNEVIKDPTTQEIIELRCSYDPETLGKNPEGRKVKGVIHWVSAKYAKPIEVNLYDRLFTIEDPAAHEDFVNYLNPNSLQVVSGALVEPFAFDQSHGDAFQFERVGYFVVHQVDGKYSANRIVNLRDMWKK
jgi:glutaminyl-tRNA synthetase